VSWLLLGLHLKRDEPCNQDGGEELPGHSFKNHCHPGERMDGNDVAEADRSQNGEAEILEMRSERLFVALQRGFQTLPIQRGR